MRHTFAKLASIALVGGLLLTGCQPGNQKISVGKVDTAELLKDDPSYQSLSIDYQKNQIDIRKEFVEKVQAAGEDRARLAALREEYMTRQKAFDDEWKTKTEDFLKAREESLHSTAEEIAKRKKIDMVVIDSEMYPTVEWGGVDMTKDMSLALSSGGGAKPSSTSTPDGDKG